jgi:NADH dehydrogenase/NADH:ubiquinone oxidoreductase subunit G
MSDLIHLTMNGQPVSVPAGTSLMNAAKQIGDEIPTICYHDACTSNGLCRLCVVEVEGARVLAPACVTTAREGMKVQTNSERVQRSRRTILELLASAVDVSDAPEILAFMDDYNAEAGRFPEAVRRDPPLLDDNPMYVRDYSKCVLCWRCVQVCAEDAQYTFAINFTGRGFETQIGTFFNQPMPATTCVFCGQCVGVCPTGALKAKHEWLLEQGNSVEEVIQATQANKKRNGKGKA